MPFSSIKFYWLAAGIFAVLFVILLSARLGVITDWPGFKEADQVKVDQSLPDRESWMNILRDGKKIGYTHSIFSDTGAGYHLEETIFLRITTLGLSHQVHLKISGQLRDDLSLAAFESRFDSGRFSFTAAGTVTDQSLELTTTAAGRTDTTTIPVETPIYLSAGLMQIVRDSGLNPGETMNMTMFDPTSLSSVPVRVSAAGRETITIGDQSHSATRLDIHVNGLTQTTWINKKGEILKEEGLMGLTRVKTDQRRALAGPLEDSNDITAEVSVPVQVKLPDPSALKRLTVAISGIETNRLDLSGGRQVLSGDRLTVTRESLEKPAPPELSREEREPFLESNPLIQADDPRIRKQAAAITAKADSMARKAELLLDWVYRNIDKRPVISLPNASATLANREGDCNEHAVLLAALARTEGLPARVETGLVYLNGRFHYHAWNSFYLKGWITADAALGQFPADVTHIRLTGGDPDSTFDLIPVIGRLKLRVINFSPRSSESIIPPAP
ncbi:MAG: transglutaminase domain-containing protein [Desulfosudaceae bacterium]